MQRRQVFRNLMAIGIGAAIPFRRLFAQLTGNRSFHRFKVGELELTVVTDGYLHMQPIQPTFAPGAPAKEVNALLKQQHRSTDAIDLGLNILVVKTGKEIILLDTGTGFSFGPNSGWLPESLNAAGIPPAAITQIIITHAHPDHIGGVYTKEGAAIFPNATVHLSKKEHAFWMAPTQDFSRSKFANKELLATFTKATQQTITKLGGKLQLFDDGAALFDCIRLELAPGHTPGHSLVHIFSNGESITHIADLMHSDVLLFPHPEWGFDGDTDFDLAAATRRKVLDKLADEQQAVFAYHLPWPGIGYVNKKAAGFEWVQQAFAIPD
ncbi:glyoxylase-like metal-dependent hydrolase (beta-lactamase superfamily II) [Chitinophaga terrae (ex Kim and Jung 2007)]|uniref:MBL fold metallo-hydrolase n=1 Tax=Chitinophaga terrae (ex Kim and Jung 2007) TaxID=408074 RepID=UPI00277F03E7|nr:MBL fold metallo-hydrolase [Chitinophaga terrae (ex Kim and Jung 2007)]MDQ0109849.1 glyoxylase-like metal-dependent hydrolase (beta-lactamase superfamily II) [Chitinophaga terrae (ex Kim and Jung 2007)]